MVQGGKKVNRMGIHPSSELKGASTFLKLTRAFTKIIFTSYVATRFMANSSGCLVVLLLVVTTLVSGATICISVEDCLSKADKVSSSDLEEQSTFLEVALNYGPSNEQRAAILVRLGKAWAALGYINKAVESVSQIVTLNN